MPYHDRMNATADVIIAGGGVAGMSTALFLARAGLQTTILERNVLGMESSWAGGGILAPLLPWHYSQPVLEMCHWGAQMYPAWTETLRALGGIDPEYWPCGMQVLPTDQITPENPTANATIYPLFSRIPDADNHSLWMPNVAQVRNPRLVKSLRKAMDAMNIQVLEHCGDTTLHVSKNHVSHIQSQHGKHAGAHYLVAGGAWSQHMLADMPPAKTIAPVRGQMLLFQTEPGLLPHILYQDGVYLIPRRDGHIVVGSTVESVGFDKSTTESARQHLHARAIQLLPELGNFAIIQQWSGLRPGAPDNIPTVARHPDIDNLFINAGHFRYGVTMAPSSAKLLTDLLLRRTPDIDPLPYAWR
jgi:glycine oxidase